MEEFSCSAIKYTAGVGVSGREVVAEEAPLQIKINAKDFSLTMRTPGNDRALVRGLLFSEGILSATAEFNYTDEIDTEPPGLVTAQVRLPEGWRESYTQSRSLLSSSACGICGKTAWDDTALTAGAGGAGEPLDITRLPAMAETMRSRQKMFHASGGTHAAAAFGVDGELLVVQEDVGRHNAVDKVVGELLATRELSLAHCILVSGRVSYEIIAKVCRAEIAHLVAISAPTSLAILMARRLGITLIGFARGESATVYAHPQQVFGKSP